MRRRIVGAAADDDVDVGPLGQHLGERLGADLRHDLDRLVDRRGREVARRPAFGDAALAQARVDHRPVDAGIDRRQLELVAVGRRQLADQVDHEIDLRVGAGAAGRADDQRDLALVGRLQHQRHVARIGLARHQRVAQPQHVRARVGRARVDDHGVDAAVDAAPEMLGGHAVAQHALRREDAKFFCHARLRSMVSAPAMRRRPWQAQRIAQGRAGILAAGTGRAAATRARPAAPRPRRCPECACRTARSRRTPS